MKALTLIPLGQPSQYGGAPPAHPASEALDAVPTASPEGTFPAGGPPAFLFASVQPSGAGSVADDLPCGGALRGRWETTPDPLVRRPSRCRDPRGSTFAFTVGERIVLVRNDTHLPKARDAAPRAPDRGMGATYTCVLRANTHPGPAPMPLFGLCTGGR